MATATQPVLKELLADPQKYPDATKYRSNDGTETTLGELRKADAARTAAKVLETPEAPVSPNAETDKRVSEIIEANRKKHNKHPIQARLGELTAKAAELEKARMKDKEEFERRLAETNEKAVQAEVDRRKAEAAANDKRPLREDFPGDANGTTEFTRQMAEWVIRQQEKIIARPAAAAVPPPQVDPAREAELKKDYDDFLEVGREFMKRNADFDEVLDGAAKRGLTLDNQAQMAIIRLKAPEVIYWLAKPENDAAARAMMKLDGIGQIAEIGRIQERLKVHPEDFVSRAGEPGKRLTGSANGGSAETDPNKMDVDTYLMKRRADIKAGLRRR